MGPQQRGQTAPVLRRGGVGPLVVGEMEWPWSVRRYRSPLPARAVSVMAWRASVGPVWCGGWSSAAAGGEVAEEQVSQSANDQGEDDQAD